MPRLSLNFFETSSVYSGDEVIFLIFHMTIGTSTQNGGRDNVCAKFNVACLKMMVTFKNETSSSLTSHFCIETLEKCSCEMVISGSLGSVLLLWFNQSSGFTSCIHGDGFSILAQTWQRSQST